jgi:predicted Zn finger-like uncharacterized protein
MITTCASCRMNLAVTVADLRVGQGYVRCGRCNRVFNALLTLADDQEEEQDADAAATGTTTVPALEDPEPEDEAPEEVIIETPPEELPAELPAIEDEDEEEDDETWERITPVNPLPTHEVDVVESQATGTFETIVLEGDGFLQTEEHVDEMEVDLQLREFARQIDSREAAAAEHDGDVQVDEHTGENIVLEDEAETQAELDADAAVGNPRRQHWGWWLASAALALALTAQMIHHGRQALVAHPWFERPMRALYGTFGVNLEPKWDLRAYDLRQLGAEAQSGTGEKIVVRATVHNRSLNSQPPPKIRVVLQDRFGNALSTTDIAPTEYLQRTAPARMAADQRLDAMLSLDDPGRQAVGFELDACLPGADGRLHCSNDR